MHDWHLPDRILQIGHRALIMSIVNVTPDSFSDGGLHFDPEKAIADALVMVDQGADLLDIGGESSRPGAVLVALDEELRRVIPVVRGLAAQTKVPLSLDTTKAEVARQGLAAGAHIINDITALLGDAAMPEVAREAKAGVILMHMQGTPATMQLDPRYQDVVAEVGQFFEARLRQIGEQGIAKEHAVLDPGIGFGKKTEHNLKLLTNLKEFQRLGRPVCLGVSRKGVFGKVLNRPVEQRLIASIAAVCWAVSHGAAQIVRVHDVAETRDAVLLLAALQSVADPAGSSTHLRA